MRRRKSLFMLNSPMQRAVDYALLLMGAFFIAIGFNLFLNPNRIVSGGVAGISTILESLWGWLPALSQWALNIPLFIAGVLLLGKQFGLKTLVGSLVLPLFVLLTSSWSAPTENLLLATVFGGLAVGAGIGLVFRGRASTGGLDLGAQILHKYTSLNRGLCVALLDGAVILVAGLIFSLEMAMYALIGVYITSKTINLVQVGFANSKVAYIISNRPEEVRRVILQDLDRGLTILDGHGGYTGDPKQVLMVVLNQREVTRLKQLVRTVDSDAFIMLSDTAEVLGEGFKLSES